VSTLTSPEVQPLPAAATGIAAPAPLPAVGGTPDDPDAIRLARLVLAYLPKVGGAIPYSLRFICKRLAEDLSKQFPAAPIAEVHAHVLSLVFEHLLHPVSADPGAWEIFPANVRPMPKHRTAFVQAADLLQGVARGDQSTDSPIASASTLLTFNKDATPVMKELGAITRKAVLLAQHYGFNEYTDVATTSTPVMCVC